MRKKRLNNSKKRTALYDALRASREHPSAEMLYGTLKSAIPELSLATVYRNLSVLVSEGAAIPVGRVDGEIRYDAVTDPHPHFICRGCGRVMDLSLPDTVSGLVEQIDERDGCLADSCMLTFFGLCDRCR